MLTTRTSICEILEWTTMKIEFTPEVIEAYRDALYCYETDCSYAEFAKSASKLHRLLGRDDVLPIDEVEPNEELTAALDEAVERAGSG